MVLDMVVHDSNTNTSWQRLEDLKLKVCLGYIMSSVPHSESLPQKQNQSRGCRSVVECLTSML